MEGYIEAIWFLPPFYEYVPWEADTLGFNPVTRDRFGTESIATYGLDWYSPWQACGYGFAQTWIDTFQRAGTVTDGKAISAAYFQTDYKTCVIQFTMVKFPGATTMFGVNRVWVKYHITDEVTGEFEIEALAGGKLSAEEFQFVTTIYEAFDVEDIRAGTVPGFASYENPY